VTASVQLVGVFLVFASLIAPAVASHALGRRRLGGAWAVGGLGYAAGLALSLLADLPAGAAVVCSLGLLAALALLLAPARAP
jgi:zinc/manganese transport system permease protein